MKKKIIAGVLSALLLTTSISVFAQETSLLNTSYEELLLISGKLNNDNATLKALLQINTSLNEANERMDTEDYKPAEVIAQATMIRTALDGVDTNLSQSGYNSNSSQRVIVSQMKNTINEINAKAEGKIQNDSKPSVVPTSRENGIEKGLHHFNFNNAPMQFSDVPSGAWYHKDVSSASAAGIIHGVGNGQFNPDGNLTEAEAMTLMANVYAIYNADTDLLAQYRANNQGGHWASGIKAYCEYRGLATPFEAEFDTNCTRGKMAFYFARSMDAIVFTPINDKKAAPENLDLLGNKDVELLFTSGILVGDEGGFRLESSITRAETAAIIHRVANLKARVTVTPKEEVPVTPPVTPQNPTNPQQPSTPTTPTNPGQVSAEKRYLNIPNTRWNGDTSVSGNFTISPHSGYINTHFGDHNYGASNQQEYDAIMKVVEEAYNHALQVSKNKTYKLGLERMYGAQSGATYNFFVDRVGFTSEDKVISIRLTQAFVGEMHNYMKKNYSEKCAVHPGSDGQDNSVYKYLFEGGMLDCDGKARMYMLCYDYLGFSTRTIGSSNVRHQVAEVNINGHWVLINQNTGALYDITHAELMLVIDSGGSYSVKTSCVDNIYKNAKSGNKHLLSDLAIRATPTHNPNDRNIR